MTSYINRNRWLLDHPAAVYALIAVALVAIIIGVAALARHSRS